jgi:hypothetical protein
LVIFSQALSRNCAIAFNFQRAGATLARWLKIRLEGQPMKLQPLNRQMRLFARRVVNLGNRRLLPGQELNPRYHNFTWRRLALLYDQRRIVSEADPYFEELMRTEGLVNNKEYAEAWLAGRKTPPMPEKDMAKPVDPPPDPDEKTPDDPFAPDPENDIIVGKYRITMVAPGWFNVFKGDDTEPLSGKNLRRKAAIVMAENLDP